MRIVSIDFAHAVRLAEGGQIHGDDKNNISSLRGIENAEVIQLK